MDQKLDEARIECQAQLFTDHHHLHEIEEAERKSLRDGCHIDVSDGGDCSMTFDLGDGRQWRKRVWPRKEYPKKLLRWNSVEEILSYLISFDRHEDWVSTEVQSKPPSGSILFFDRSKTKKYRNDDYDWKTRRTMINTVREDRMKLKVGGYQLIYGCYAHSASDPNFHRRTYWLIQNPNLIMVHYLDSHEFFSSYNCISAAAREQVLLRSEPYLTTSNWSLMTISDLNLCALLDMAKTADKTKALLSQVTRVLSSNFGQSSTLAEVLAANNAGFPVNMFEDTRSKKAKLINAQPRKDADTSGKRFFMSQNLQMSDIISSKQSKSNEVLSVLSLPPQALSSPKLSPRCTPTRPPPATADRMSLPRIPHNMDDDISMEGSAMNVVEEGLVDMEGSMPLETTWLPHNFGENKASNELLETLQSALKGLIQPLEYEFSSPGTMLPGTAHAQPGTAQPGTTHPGTAQPGTAQPGTTHPGTTAQQPGTIKFGTAHPGTTAQQPGTIQSGTTTQHPGTTAQLDPNHRHQETIPIAAHPQRPISSSPSSPSQFADLFLNAYRPRVSSSVSEDDTAPAPRESRTSSFRSTESNLTDSLGHSSHASCGSSASMPQPPAPKNDNHLSEQEKEMSLRLPDVPISCWLFPGEQASSQMPCTSPSTPRCRPYRGDTGLYPSSTTPTEPVYIDSHQILNNPGGQSDPLMETTFEDTTFNLDFDSENWQHLLQYSPVQRHTIEGHPTTLPSTSQSNYQLGDDLNTLSGTATTSTSPLLTPDTSTPDNIGVGNIPQLSVPHVTVTVEKPNSWNGMWQDCNPDDINSWLQSSIPEDESNTLSSIEAMQTSLSPSSSPTTTHVTHTSPEFHDFLFDATITHPHPPNNGCVHNEIETGNMLSSPSTTMGFSGAALLPSEEFDNSTSNSSAMGLPSATSNASNMGLSGTVLLSSDEFENTDPVRKISDVSIYSEPLMSGSGDASSPRLSRYHHLSLPNLTNADLTSFPSINITPTSSDNSFIDSGLSSLAGHTAMLSNTSLSPSPLQDIPEGIQMELESSHDEISSLLGYRGNCSRPSSPASITSSTVSIQDLFDEPPSIRALCEMLSESANVRQNDFSGMILTDSEQAQLFRAAETIQGAFRKYKSRRQLRTKEKSAALLIEQYYKEYRDAKNEKERAARRIQNQYRIYKLRTRELNRAATFIQQMYRFQRIRKPSTHPYQRPK